MFGFFHSNVRPLSFGCFIHFTYAFLKELLGQGVNFVMIQYFNKVFFIASIDNEVG